MMAGRKLIWSHLWALALLVAPLAYGTVTPSDKSVTPLAPLPEHSITTRHIVDALASRHYVTHPLDDQLSSEILDTYIKDLDPTRSYLLQSDIDQFEIYRNLLDDAIRHGDVEPAYKIFNRYLTRVLDRYESNIRILERGIGQFDFTKEESLELDREHAPWAKTMSELDDLWRKRLKDSILSLKLAGKEDSAIEELMLKRYRNRVARTRQTNSEDVFQIFMNAYTGTYDPHTQYFSPRTAENFNMNMSLSLEGIGAVLGREDEFTKVISLVPAGPADKSHLLHPDDRIVAVGQGDEGEMVDVVGWRLDDVVQLIRGKKGTVVRLEIIDAENQDNSASRVIKLTRNMVQLEEQSAKSEVIELEQFGHKHKIGVIDIPTFYIDFQALQRGDRNFRSTTRDVTNLLVDLMAEHVEGVIIDLRDNGGGSLQEANALTGLFIDRGPTVQIRGRSNRVDIMNDRDFRTVYDGPLAVLVNRLSASASEIFAGAIQDYDRGVIIGSQTFGKGTVQSLINLNRGQLKLTQAKFYRISGESTQHQGVIPDILYPESYDSTSIGESSLSDPLPWDKIAPTQYHPKGEVHEYLAALRERHAARSEADPEFTYLRDALAYRRERDEEKSVTLNEKERKERKAEVDAHWLALENRRRQAEGLAKIDSLDELDGDAEPALAQANPHGGATGITPPASGSTSQQGELQGNELVGVVGGSEEAGQQKESGEKSAKTDEEGVHERDAMLVESGNILLDLIDLEHRTATGASAAHSS